MLADRIKQVDWRPSNARLQRFGVAWLIGFPCLAAGWFCLVRLSAGHWVWQVPAWIAGVGAGLGLLCVAAPPLGRPFHLLWQCITLLLDLLFSLVLLTTMYMLVVTPVGLVQRTIGRRAFRKGFDRSAGTYWVEAEKIADSRRYLRQF